MKGLCEPVQDKKNPNNYIFSCDGLVVFPQSPITDTKHKYLIDFELKTSRSGKKYGIVASQEVFHEFKAVQEENKANLDVKKFDTHYTLTLSRVKIKVEECKVCQLRKVKEFPETDVADIVVSEIDGEVIYSPYREANLPSYNVIKYLEENKVKLEPNIRYKRVGDIIVPEDVDISSLKLEEIKEMSDDVDAYSYDKRKFVHLFEEERRYKIGDEDYVDVVKYYTDGGEKHVVSIETYKEVYEYEPTFYSSYEDDNPDDYARVTRLVERKTFENIVKVNAMFLNLHRRKAMAFKALYKALVKAGYKVTITRDGDNVKVRVKKGNEYGETARYAEFPVGHYAVLADKIYDLIF